MILRCPFCNSSRIKRKWLSQRMECLDCLAVGPSWARGFEWNCRFGSYQGGPANARLEWGDQEPDPNGYPDEIWFTPPDNNSVGYVRRRSQS
jgi:hypothetical protein